MGLKEEVAVGIGQIRERIERGGRLKLTRSSSLTDRFSQYFVISSDSKKIDFAVSYEFLSDLPNTREYQRFLEEYALLLEKRFLRWCLGCVFSQVELTRCCRDRSAWWFEHR